VHAGEAQEGSGYPFGIVRLDDGQELARLRLTFSGSGQ
jgi:hypothetical protein